MALKLTTTAFPHEGTIPDKYSKDGGDLSPALSWTGVPEGTRHLALIVDDPDAPSGVFVHWLVYGLSPKSTGLEEGQPKTPKLANGAYQGINDYGEIGYGGPQPPSGTHRYFFRLYAVDTDLEIPTQLTRQELDGAIMGHILDKAEIMGRYQHKEGQHQEKTRGA